MRFSAVAVTVVVALNSSFAAAQSGGSSSGGSSGGGASGGNSSSTGTSTMGGYSSNSPAGAPAANAISGTTGSPTLSNSVQGAPGTPNSQPNTYNALSRGSSANQMGTIGGSNSAGAGNAAPGSAVDNLSSTNTGVVAPSSNATVQPGR